MTRQPILEFWYEFASTYSYLAAMRDRGGGAGGRGRARCWRPFLLGPVFAAQGWDHLAVQPLSRPRAATCGATWSARPPGSGCPSTGPNPFPQNGLLAARVALLGADRGWTPAFTRAVYTAEFGEGRDIADPQVVSRRS